VPGDLLGLQHDGIQDGGIERAAVKEEPDAATVQPQSPGVSDTNRTARAKPGSAPSTAMGPVRQCPRGELISWGGSSPGWRCRAR
jgi:hypothetical protein